MPTGRLRLLTRRRLVLPPALLAAALVSLAALGAAGDWSFRQNDGPTPASTPVVAKGEGSGDPFPSSESAPVVVKEGEWSGRRWQLTAYPSSGHGLCFSVAPLGSSLDGSGGAMSCAPFVGVPRTEETRGSSEMTITFLSGAARPGLPAYIAGPVIDKASTVEIQFGTGEVLRLPTFSGAVSLGRVRFYATQLPASIRMPRPDPLIQNQATFINTLAGLDGDGNVVACLAPRTAVGGGSPLSHCQRDENQ
jgi:hypothetical protein